MEWNVTSELRSRPPGRIVGGSGQDGGMKFTVERDVLTVNGV
jgi:hypothetical protein